MTKSTKVVNTIEMTKEEYSLLWERCQEIGERCETRAEAIDAISCELGFTHWCTNDGNDALLMNGEDFYRDIVITPITL